LDVGRYLRELSSSGLAWVALAYVMLILVNVVTLAAGTQRVLAELNSSPVGALLSPFVFDSWGTIGGLAGVVLLFSPVLFGTPVSQRRSLSLFFVASGIGIGVSSALLWDAYYDTTGFFGSGSSSIAITAQGVIFALSGIGLLRLARQDTRRLGALSSHWWYSFAIIYITLILTSLWFILSLEPIFIPTILYNWRVHEFGFLFGSAAALVFAGAKWSGLGLDGVVRIDESLLNYHYDDLCSRFPERLPKYHVTFGELASQGPAELQPERAEIVVSERFRDKDFGVEGPELEKALLRAMVQVELQVEGLTLNQDSPEYRERFGEVAKKVGASLEP